jgi:hypothetical protein
MVYYYDNQQLSKHEHVLAETQHIGTNFSAAVTASTVATTQCQYCASAVIVSNVLL